MFDAISHRYDLANDIMSFGFHRQWLQSGVKSLEIPNNAKILDIATGTGLLAFKIAKYYPNSEIFAIDLAPKMLEIAKEKLSKSNHQNIKFIEADALNLPFTDNFFDAITISWGIRNIKPVEKCLEEIVRVSKNDASLMILEFGIPTGLFAYLYNIYSKFIVEKIGGWISGNQAAYNYLRTSIRNFPYGKDFLKLLENNGNFINCEYKKLSFGAVYLYRATIRK